MRLSAGWRLAVVVALLLYALIAGTVVLIVLRNPLLAALSVPVAMSLAYGT